MKTYVGNHPGRVTTIGMTQGSDRSCCRDSIRHLTYQHRAEVAAVGHSSGVHPTVVDTERSNHLVEQCVSESQIVAVRKLLRCEFPRVEAGGVFQSGWNDHNESLGVGQGGVVGESELFNTTGTQTVPVQDNGQTCRVVIAGRHDLLVHPFLSFEIKHDGGSSGYCACTTPAAQRTRGVRRFRRGHLSWCNSWRSLGFRSWVWFRLSCWCRGFSCFSLRGRVRCLDNGLVLSNGRHP